MTVVDRCFSPIVYKEGIKTGKKNLEMHEVSCLKLTEKVNNSKYGKVFLADSLKCIKKTHMLKTRYVRLLTLFSLVATSVTE